MAQWMLVVDLVQDYQKNLIFLVSELEPVNIVESHGDLEAWKERKLNCP